MATKKQKRARMEAKRVAEDVALVRSGLEAQRKDRERRAAEKEKNDSRTESTNN